jgi:nucleoside-diphosphate-sugar epimerase
MLVDILREHFDDLTIEHVERDPLKPLRGTLSIAKAKRLLGYEPKHDLATGYPAYIRWYLESEYRALHVDPGRDG